MAVFALVPFLPVPGAVPDDTRLFFLSTLTDAEEGAGMLPPFVAVESVVAGAAAAAEAFGVVPLLVRLRFRFCFPPPVLSSASDLGSSSSLAFLDEDGLITVCQQRKTYQFTSTGGSKSYLGYGNSLDRAIKRGARSINKRVKK